jgi:hypothetical protein
MEAGRGYREDDQLKRGEAQLYQLQQQVDELRRLLRELMARQSTGDEYSKQNQSLFLQMRDQMDKQVADFNQAFQVRVLEEHRIKQEIAELQARASEPIKPLRELRSQITEMSEQRRREGEQVNLDKHALEKLGSEIRNTQAQIGRLDNHIKDLREAIKITANAQEFYQRELERLGEAIYNWEQLVRRQGDEFREEIKTLRAEVQLFANRITRLEDLQRIDAARIEEFPPVLDVLRQEDERILGNVVRVEKLTGERIAIVQDRLEEIRQQAESGIFNLNQLFSTQVDSDSLRFTQLDERMRTSESQLQETQLRIEQVKQLHEAELFEIYQMEEAVQSTRLEHIQAEYEMVRQHRAKAQASRMPRRSGNRHVRRHRSEQDYDDQLPPEDNSI